MSSICPGNSCKSIVKVTGKHTDETLVAGVVVTATVTYPSVCGAEDWSPVSCWSWICLLADSAPLSPTELSPVVRLMLCLSHLCAMLLLACNASACLQCCCLPAMLARTARTEASLPCLHAACAAAIEPRAITSCQPRAITNR
jgi:hypothetical protein